MYIFSPSALGLLAYIAIRQSTLVHVMAITRTLAIFAELCIKLNSYSYKCLDIWHLASLHLHASSIPCMLTLLVPLMQPLSPIYLTHTLPCNYIQLERMQHLQIMVSLVYRTVSLLYMHACHGSICMLMHV